ncbi:MAG: phage portal protein, partial [Candidatus Rokuibacteriota bacterium]
MSFLHRVKQAAEHLFFPRWGWGGSLYMGLPRTRYNYAADLGDGLGSSVLMGVVQWGMRTFPEAPLVVRQQQGTTLEIRPGHPLARLVARPNDAYPGEQLWMVSYWSWCVFGNVYWRVVHTTGDRPVQLWWVPPWQMEPQWPSDGSRFLSHYRYTPGTGPGMDLGLNEVIHIRHGLHPHNPRLGLSPLWSAVREVWGDDEASNWVASLLRNSAVPSVIITPSGDFPVETGDLEEIKAYLKENFTGDGRGEPLALQSPADVHRLGFNPSELDLSAVRDTAEERVCALLGIPAAVVGFGTGIQHTRVGATMHEQVGLAWNNGIIPVHRIMDAEVGRVLLPQIERQPDRFVVGREYSEVKALQEDRTALFTRANMGVTGGWMRVDQAKTMVGLMPEPGDAVYLRSFAMIEVGPDARRVAPPGLPLPEGQEPSRDDDPEKGAKGRKQAPRVDSPPAVLLRLVARLERESILQQMVFADEVTAELEALGEQAASAAQTVLAP